MKIHLSDCCTPFSQSQSSQHNVNPNTKRKRTKEQTMSTEHYTENKKLYKPNPTKTVDEFWS